MAENARYEELLRSLRERDLAIFGTGYGSEMFCFALERLGLMERVRFFVVGEPARREETFRGRPVYALRDAPLEGELLCVAVHDALSETLLPEIRAVVPDALWIYPWLTRMIFGTPTIRQENSVVELTVPRGDEFWLAVRYAAVRDYLGAAPKYPRTRELYCRCMAFHCSVATAEKRAAAMEALARSMTENGFDAAHPLRVTRDGRIIDGLHRAACARYLGLRRIPAEIYPDSDAFDTLFGEKNRLPESFLHSRGITPKELDFLRAARRELEAGF